MKAKKPGGNYTQPVVDDDNRLIEVIAYVGWEEIGRFESETEAAEAVKRRLKGDDTTPPPAPSVGAGGS